jgi:hypothetical protein
MLQLRPSSAAAVQHGGSQTGAIDELTCEGCSMPSTPIPEELFNLIPAVAISLQRSQVAGSVPVTIVMRLVTALLLKKKPAFDQLLGDGAPTAQKLTNAVKDVVGKIQSALGLEGLVDLPLAEKILGICGDAIPQGADNGDQGSVDPANGTILVAYRISPDIPKRIGDLKTDLLLDIAVSYWKQALADGSGGSKLITRDVTSLPGKFFNVDIVWEPLDGTGMLLGLTDVGGPGRMAGPLKLRLNSQVEWTPFLLLGAASHEFGHALGLHHLPDRMDLMHDSIDLNVDQPGVDDLKALRTLWT